jgi:hypothetical protein
MKSKSFTLGQSPRLVFLACAGDLRAQSWDQPEVQLLLAREEDLAAIRLSDSGLEISATMPATVHVPPGASIVLESCAGDLHAAGIASVELRKHRGDVSLHQTGNVELNQVHGDVLVHEARSLQLAVMHGDLRVRGLAEGLTLRDLHGDVSLKHVGGTSTLQGITGDVVIRDPVGGVDARAVTGDLRLAGAVRAGETTIEVLGDISLCLDQSSDVQIELEASLGQVHSSTALSESTRTAHRLEGKLGEGTAHLFARSNSGDIRLDWGPVHAGQRRDDSAAELSRFEAGIEQRSDEQAARARRWRAHWPDATRAEPEEPLEDERLAILKMLADGRVSPDQAAELLQAMEP